MYFEYLREREPEISVIQHSEGFLLYKDMLLDGELVIYIQDVYIIPEARDSNLATKMALEVEGIASSRGITKILGTVVPSAKGSTTSVKVLIAYGMKLLSSSDDIIWFIKEI